MPSYEQFQEILIQYSIARMSSKKSTKTAGN